jgi:uncharacterized membrane protein (DUF373 family)
MEKILNRINRWVVYLLMIIIMLLVVIATIQLVIYIIHSAIDARVESELGFLSAAEYVLIFGFIMNVIIILELYETVKMYLKESKFHAEIILMVTIIAVSRGIIMIEFKGEHFEPLLIFGFGALILALASSYYLIKRSRSLKKVK